MAEDNPETTIVLRCTACDNKEPLRRFGLVSDGILRLVKNKFICSKCGEVFEMEITSVGNVGDFKGVEDAPKSRTPRTPRKPKDEDPPKKPRGRPRGKKTKDGDEPFVCKPENRCYPTQSEALSEAEPGDRVKVIHGENMHILGYQLHNPDEEPSGEE